jgi:ethanolamine ammonia-lyase large subunit
MLKYYEQTFHNIAGTRSRFSLKPISPYESWRDRLPKSSLTMFALCGGHYFNRRFGVHAG